MKKFLILLLGVSAVVSCSKSVKVPIAYSVETPGTGNADKIKDIDIPNTGETAMPVSVKFLSGYAYDSVSVSLLGLPFDIDAVKDTIGGIPTYTANFSLVTKNARPGVYPVTLVARAKGSDAKSIPFNITVVRTDCSSNFIATLRGSNACDARNYTYTATVTGTSNANEVNMSNFGGYGATTTTYMKFDCKTNTVNVPLQTIGNNTTLQGSGTFTDNTITITYTASTTPTGPGETCTATFTLQ